MKTIFLEIATRILLREISAVSDGSFRSDESYPNKALTSFGVLTGFNLGRDVAISSRKRKLLTDLIVKIEALKPGKNDAANYAKLRALISACRAAGERASASKQLDEGRFGPALGEIEHLLKIIFKQLNALKSSDAPEDEDSLEALESSDVPEDEGLLEALESSDVPEDRDPLEALELSDAPEDGDLLEALESGDAPEDRDLPKALKFTDDPKNWDLLKALKFTDVPKNRNPLNIYGYYAALYCSEKIIEQRQQGRLAKLFEHPSITTTRTLTTKKKDALIASIVSCMWDLKALDKQYANYEDKEAERVTEAIEKLRLVNLSLCKQFTGFFAPQPGRLGACLTDALAEIKNSKNAEALESKCVI